MMLFFSDETNSDDGVTVKFGVWGGVMSSSVLLTGILLLFLR